VAYSNYESMQHMILNSHCDTKRLMQNIAVNVSYLMKSRAVVGLIIDDKAHLKKGTKSAGLARQLRLMVLLEK